MAGTADRKAEVLAGLTDGIANLTTSAAWLDWLQFSRRFHHYSFSNQLLIQRQSPGASRVAGFHTWHKLGRSVRKGEKGIAIIAPVVSRIKVTDDGGTESTVAGAPRTFRLAYVFDVSQTDGQDLPEMPISRLQGDDPDCALARLTEVAAGMGYAVRFVDFRESSKNGDCSFFTKQIRLRNGLAPAMACKTLAHECAHALLHADATGTNRKRAELEAESVAYIVSDRMSIDSSGYTFAYLTSWAGGGIEAIKAITESGARIVKAAHNILGSHAEDVGQTRAVAPHRDVVDGAEHAGGCGDRSGSLS